MLNFTSVDKKWNVEKITEFHIFGQGIYLQSVSFPLLLNKQVLVDLIIIKKMKDKV